jgi:hypothetical protein
MAKCYSKFMNLEAKKKLTIAYLACSVLIILCFIFFVYGPFWHRDPLSIADQYVSTTWYENQGTFFGFLLLPAIYGIGSISVIDRLRRGIKLGNGYFIGALVVGIVSTLSAWAYNNLSHLDCGLSCSGGVTPYGMGIIMVILAALLSVGVPIYLMRQFKPTNKKK